MTTTWRSFAKINLHLEVHGRRPDGFHELVTVFQSVSLHDLVTVEPRRSGITLAVRGEAVPTDASNLAWRAAEAFLRRWGEGGVAIALDKRIPVGGGLGGGSSNAATVLRALQALHGAPSRAAELAELAADLGSDVPFFLTGGTALGTGRGERIEPLPDLAEEAVWIVDPGVHVSTRDVFGAGPFSRPPPGDETVERLRRGAVERPSEAGGVNVLEEPVLRLYPAVRAVYTAWVQSGAERVRLTGSGGCLYAFAARTDERPLPTLSRPGVRCFAARTVPRKWLETRWIVDSVGGP